MSALTFRHVAMIVLGGALLGAPHHVVAAPSMPPRLDVTTLADHVRRCPQGMRRHTITGKCVRSGSKYLWF
jgi:hypothetical protein